MAETETSAPKVSAGETVIGILLGGGLLILAYLGLAWMWDAMFGGGIWSLYDAFRQTGGGAARVEVDRDASGMLMIALVFAIAAVAASAVLKVFPDIAFDKVPSAGIGGTILSLIVVLIWFSFSGFLSEMINDRVLASRHYLRCPALAHHTGGGKTRTDFDVYLARAGDCPPSGAR